MCALREKMMESGRCTGKCDHHKPKKEVMAVVGTAIQIAAISRAKDYCSNKENCTTACPQLGNPMFCKLVA